MWAMLLCRRTMQFHPLVRCPCPSQEEHTWLFAALWGMSFSLTRITALHTDVGHVAMQKDNAVSSIGDVSLSLTGRTYMAFCSPLRYVLLTYKNNSSSHSCGPCCYAEGQCSFIHWWCVPVPHRKTIHGFLQPFEVCPSHLQEEQLFTLPLLTLPGCISSCTRSCIHRIKQCIVANYTVWLNQPDKRGFLTGAPNLKHGTVFVCLD
jgi:hypothetical protein